MENVYKTFAALDAEILTADDARLALLRAAYETACALVGVEP